MAKNHDFSDVVANFGTTRIFLGNPAVLRHLFFGSLTSCKKSWKSLERILRCLPSRIPTNILVLCSTAVSLKAHVSTLVKIYARLLNRIIVHLLVNTAQLCNLLLSSCHSDHFFIQVILLLPSYHLMASY